VVDNSEFALYKIDKLINESIDREIDITSRICDVSRAEDIEDIFKLSFFDTIYHSAAYKHVPILEHNIIQAARNNIIGTYNLIEAAKKYKSKKFVLISTDKAVRPTNVMGATKRFCELLLQAQNNTDLVFTMVRFGNVLGSSGSVIPIFKKQIFKGGPVTVTSKDATRYFMTIKEASELVIQAASMAKGGEVFLLDMGSPINIYQLAEKMIEAYGYSNNSNESNYIEIKVTGLRPGEKIIEELLIDNNPQQTQHKNIFKSKEPKFSINDMENKYKLIRDSIKNSNQKMVIKILRETIDGYE
jgi:FlaA1/EpsC-like NDP-sugar epimerase